MYSKCSNLDFSVSLKNIPPPPLKIDPTFLVITWLLNVVDRSIVLFSKGNRSFVGWNLLCFWTPQLVSAWWTQAFLQSCCFVVWINCQPERGDDSRISISKAVSWVFQAFCNCCLELTVTCKLFTPCKQHELPSFNIWNLCPNPANQTTNSTYIM